MEEKSIKEKITIGMTYICVSFYSEFCGSGLIPVATCECSMLPDNNILWYFNRLYVSPNFRNQGYGSMLLEKMLPIIKEKGYILQLDINPYGEMTYEQLEKFYTKHGFVKTTEKTKYGEEFPRYYYNAFI